MKNCKHKKIFTHHELMAIASLCDTVCFKCMTGWTDDDKIPIDLTTLKIDDKYVSAMIKIPCYMADPDEWYFIQGTIIKDE